MDTHSSEEVEEISPPLRTQPEWEDMVPLPTEDGGSTGAIRYMPDHADALGYFRAIVQSGERSQRALWLTEQVLEYNSSDYTAWQLRWECLQELGADLEPEYELCERIASENVKNYQLWNHRRKCMLAIGESAAARELEFSEAALSEDAKNYHAWAHRQVVVRQFGLWQQELAFVGELIKDDVLNNSAWNQRMFVVKHLVQDQDVWQVVKDELAYVAERIQWEPHNESSWSHLRGLFTLEGLPDHAMSRCQEVFQICRDVLAKEFSIQAAEVLASYYGGLASLLLATQRAGDAEHAVKLATALVDRLAEEDPLRNNYWSFRHEELAALLSD